MQTFEDVETALGHVNVEHHLEAGKLENVYKVAKPILVLITNFIIIPKKWRMIVATLISVIEAQIADNAGDANSLNP